MYPVGDGRAVDVTSEALIDTVVLSSRLIVGQDERTTTNHLLYAKSVDDQRPIVLCPLISRSHTLPFTPPVSRTSTLTIYQRFR